MKNLLKAVSVVFMLITSGCAHQINLTPPLNTLDKEGLRLILKNAGYYISDEDRAKEVTTPGGGGDKVKYTLYEDIEPGLKHALSNIFSNVYTIPSLDDSAFITSNNIEYIFVPTITTDSSSDSAFTWPPTDFTVQLHCQAINPAGDTIWETTVEGEGHAEYDQFKHDFSLSARKAVKNALLMLQEEISKADEIK